MKKTTFSIILVLIIFLAGCTENKTLSPQTDKKDVNVEQAELSKCERAGGIISFSKECNGHELEWCEISKEEQCYADQVANGKCPQNISPRVLCNNDSEENSNMLNDYKKCKTNNDCFGTWGCGAGCYSKNPPKSFFSQEDCPELIIADNSCVCINEFCEQTR